MISNIETIGTDSLYGLKARDIVLWTGAMALVVAVQAGGLWAYLRQPAAPDGPAAPPPMIMIEFTDAAMAPEAEDLTADPGPEALEQAALEEIEAPQPEPEPEVLPEEVPDIEAEPLPALEPETPSEQEAQEPEPEPVPEPVEEVVPDLIEAESAEVSLPMPVAMPADIQRLRENTPARVPETRQQPRQPRPQPPQQASRQSAPPSVPVEAGPQVAAPQTVVSQAAPNISPQQWQTRVITHLDRFKRYPAEARNRGERGIPRIQITIDPAGRVLGASIVRSSGFPALDRAAVEMAQNASPLPAPPAAIASQPRIALTVPVNFDLRW